ncbi:MAG TPA: DUF305 domain-containing protein [Longimicrobiales bacterium]
MYRKLALAIGINTVLMYLITYVNLAQLSHFENNINRVYMALLMAAPMVIVMLLVMRAMFPNVKMNLGLHVGAAVAILLLVTLIRTQTPVGNGQFLRSMIPHHSSAILMCEQSAITDPEIIELCGEIVQAQKEEIAQMKDILSRD